LRLSLDTLADQTGPPLVEDARLLDEECRDVPVVERRHGREHVSLPVVQVAVEIVLLLPAHDEEQ